MYFMNYPSENLFLANPIPSSKKGSARHAIMPSQANFRDLAISEAAAEADPMDFVDSLLDGFGDDCFEVEAAPEKKFKSKNLEAERRRRTKLNGKLLELRALVPKITKMSKESTLTDAMNYIKSLQQEIVNLQIELEEPEEGSGEKQLGSASSSGSMSPATTVQLQGKVEIDAVGRNKYQIKTICRNKQGKFTKMLEALKAVNAQVNNANCVSFSGFFESAFSIEVKEDRDIHITSLRKQLLEIVEVSHN